MDGILLFGLLFTALPPQVQLAVGQVLKFESIYRLSQGTGKVKIPSSTSSLIVDAGDQLDFECAFLPATPIVTSNRPAVKLLLNNTPLRAIWDYNVNSFRTEALPTITAASGGLYKCEVGGSVVQSVELLVKPTLQITPQEFRGQGDHSPFNFTAMATGYPTPTVEWFRKLKSDNSWIRRVTGPIFRLNTAEPYWPPDHEFLCRATNRAGTVQQSAYLLLLDPLKFIRRPPSSYHAVKGRPLKLFCNATGAPLSMTWQQYKGSAWVSVDPSFVKFTEPVYQEKALLLTVPGVETQKFTALSTLKYRCLLSSLVPYNTSEKAQLSISAETSIAVWEVPVFLHQNIMGVHDIEVGNDFHFTCLATGAPTPSVNYTQDGIIRVGDVLSQNQLFYKSAKTQDSGIYECVVYNSLGSVRGSEVILTVIQNISFVTEPPDVPLAVVNTSVSLSCLATGYPPVHYSWFKNGSALHNETKATLVLNNIQLSQSGIYWCEARLETDRGSVKRRKNSRKAVVQVYVPAEISPLSAAPSTAVHPGAPVNITCVAKGVPTPNLTWTRAGKPLAGLGLTYSLFQPAAGVSVLVIPVVRLVDRGDYQCTADNLANKDTRSIKIDGPFAPSFLQDLPPKKNFVTGRTLRVFCNTTGNPQPQVSWYRSNVLLLGTGRMRSKDGYLVVEKFEAGDAGKFTCTANNSVSLIDGSVTIVLQEEVVVTQPPSDKVVLPRTSATFQCTATGIPKPTISWLSNANSISSTTDFKISTLTPPDGGGVGSSLTVSNVISPTTISCMASNSWNEVTRNATLSLIAVPATPGDLTSNITGVDVTLTWMNTMASPLQPIDRFLISYWIAGQERTAKVEKTEKPELTLKRLKANTSYVWQVRAANGAGESDLSMKAYFQTGTLPTEEQRSSSENFYEKVWFFAAAGGVGGLILLAIIIGVCMRRRNKDAIEMFNPDTIRPAQQPPASPRPTWTSEPKNSGTTFGDLPEFTFNNVHREKAHSSHSLAYAEVHHSRDPSWTTPV